MKKQKKTERNKKSLVILIGIIIFITIIYFASFLVSKKYTEENQKIIQEKTVDVGTEIITGELRKMHEQSIDVLGPPKEIKIGDEMKISREIESYNISLVSPVTPVTVGLDADKKDGRLSDLKIGQTIMIEYDKQTKNALSIVIVLDKK
ncbi:MAG: hypothetical protein WAV31_04140 [Candidatus Moraniibacteriota bacterium]